MGSLSSQTWLRHIPRNSVHTRHKHANFEDDDELVKYNATSILARIATVAPDAVEPVTDSLREALSVDHPPTQQNACWALGRIGATTLDQNCKLFERKLKSKTPGSSNRWISAFISV